MKNKKIIYVIIFILSICIFSGCETKPNVDLLIISSPDNKTINYYEYDITKKVSKKIYSINKTCYPTATLSNDNKILYFTKSDDQGFPQLFERNLSTNDEKQLTSKEENKIINVDFLKINYKKNVIYLRVVQENHRNFNLAMYDISSNKLNIVDADENDLSNQFFDFNNSSDSILSFQNSVQEEHNLLVEANKNKKPNSPPTYNLTLKDDSVKDEKVYGSIENNVVDVSMSPDNQSAIILTGEVSNLSEHEFKKQILFKNLNTNESESILSNEGPYKDITKLSFSRDGKGFYFVSSKDAGQYGLYYYDLESRTISSILNIDNENILDCIVIHK